MHHLFHQPKSTVACFGLVCIDVLVNTDLCQFKIICNKIFAFLIYLFLEFSRNVQDLRHKILDKLETHGEPWPPACPPLEPTR